MKVNVEVNLPDIEFTSTKQQRLESNQYAKMEPKTQRIRERLAKRLIQQDKKITDQALLAAKVNMVKWLQRHEGERVVLRSDKATSSFFTDGKSFAEASPKIQAIRDRIAQSFSAAAKQISKNISEHTSEALRGRIKKSQ